MTESGSARRGVVKRRKVPATGTWHKLALEQATEVSVWPGYWHSTDTWCVVSFCVVVGQWHRAVLQKGAATPSWRELEVFPRCNSTWYDVILTAPSSPSALQPWVGLGFLKQLSPAPSILDIRPPISTTQLPCVFIYPVNPSWFRSAMSSLTSGVWQALMSDLRYCISTCLTVYDSPPVLHYMPSQWCSHFSTRVPVTATTWQPFLSTSIVRCLM